MGLYAQPSGPDWEVLLARFHELMEWLHDNLALDSSQVVHRRGRYGTVGVGYGFGGGRQRPGEYAASAHNTQLLKSALANPVIK
jgi:hypothetical protein